MKLHFIQPGKPTQNAFVESFNGPSEGTNLKKGEAAVLVNLKRLQQEYRDVYAPHAGHKGDRKGWFHTMAKVTGIELRRLELRNMGEYPDRNDPSKYTYGIAGSTLRQPTRVVLDYFKWGYDHSMDQVYKQLKNGNPGLIDLEGIERSY